MATRGGGCGCGGARAGASADGNAETLGFRAFLPNGEVVPPRDKAPFFMAVEALNEVTQARGGSTKRIRITDTDDPYAVAKAAQRAALAAS